MMHDAGFFESIGTSHSSISSAAISPAAAASVTTSLWSAQSSCVKWWSSTSLGTSHAVTGSRNPGNCDHVPVSATSRASYRDKKASGEESAGAATPEP